MPSPLLLLLIAVGAALAVGGRPRTMAWVLTTTWLLVPGSVRVPGAGTGQLLVVRVIVGAVLVGLVRGWLLGRLPERTFAVRGAHVAFVAFLAVALTTGVILAEPRIPTTLNTNTYASIAEQGIFFATALGVFRSVGARRGARIVTVIAGVLAGIAISEALLSWSYSQWFTADLTDPSGLLALDLTTRGPHERVRASALFALELGWITALLIPVTVATAIAARGRARLLWAVPAALLVSMVWTWSRSAYAGLAVGMAVLALGVVVDRPRRTAPVGLVGVAIGALLLQGPVRTALDLGTTSGEPDVRFQRLPELLEIASADPMGGLGLGGLLVRQFDVVDLSWVNSYLTIGLVGVAALAVLLVSTAHAAGRFLLSGPSPTRMVAAGAAAAVIVAPIGMAAYDLFSLRNSTQTVWGLAALSLAGGEELGVLSVPMRRRAEVVPRPALVLGLLGLGGGFAAALLVPTVHSLDATFTTVHPRTLAVAGSAHRYSSKVLGQTACLVIDEVDVGASVSCREVDRIAGGVGKIRIEASRPGAVVRAYESVRSVLVETFAGAEVAVVEQGSGRPTWATTAPFWMFVTGFASGALLPDRRYRTVGRPAPGQSAPVEAP